VLWESLKSMNLRLERLLMLVLIMLPILLVLTLVLVLLMVLQLRMGSVRSLAAVHSYVPVRLLGLRLRLRLVCVPPCVDTYTICTICTIPWLSWPLHLLNPFISASTSVCISVRISVRIHMSCTVL
jgi:hypothetical protein